MEDLKAMFSSLDELLNKTDLEDVTAESTGYQDLPDGYYLSEVEKAEIIVYTAQYIVMDIH